MATQFSVQDNKPWETTFFTIWSGQALSILGSQPVQFALIWYLTVQTSSATVKPEMQARIFALLSSIGTGIAPLGLMIAGPVADRVGIQTWFLLGGMLCVFMAVTGLFISAVRNMEKRSFPLPKVGRRVKQAI